MEDASKSAVAPEPGIYPGVPMDEYLGWDCASNSRLRRLRRSPAHLKAYLDDVEAKDGVDDERKTA